MSRGPAPTPTALLELRGSRRAERRRNEPKPVVSAPVCPRVLQGEARREWKRLVPILLQMRVLTKADCVTLTMYCRAWERWLKAEKMLEFNPEVHVTEKGYPLISPWFVVANQTQQQLTKLGSELGLSPASRARIRIETDKPQEDDLAKFFDN